jgi:hypothetical protein
MEITYPLNRVIITILCFMSVLRENIKEQIIIKKAALLKAKESHEDEDWCNYNTEYNLLGDMYKQYGGKATYIANTRQVIFEKFKI